MLMLKFGRLVDLEKLETVTVNRTVEELKGKITTAGVEKRCGDRQMECKFFSRWVQPSMNVVRSLSQHDFGPLKRIAHPTTIADDSRDVSNIRQCAKIFRLLIPTLCVISEQDWFVQEQSYSADPWEHPETGHLHCVVTGEKRTWTDAQLTTEITGGCWKFIIPSFSKLGFRYSRPQSHLALLTGET